MTKTYTHAPVSKSSVLSYLTVIFGALAGWGLFNEKPDLWILLGIGCVILGGVLAFLDKSQPMKL